MPPDEAAARAETPSLSEALAACLAETDPWLKAARTRSLAAKAALRPSWTWGTATAPERPGRPERPPLLPPTEVPRRKIGPAPEGRIALLHALAHIELNAVDLALDLPLRFLPSGLLKESEKPAFLDDWLAVADDEARHFLLLSERLAALGARYGDLGAHDGLWQAALSTAGDLLARLAVVPMVLEARGLDVTPGMIQRLRSVGDRDSAAALEVIYEDEVTHVSVGRRWFQKLCERSGLDAVTTWQSLVRRHFKGVIRPPFNEAARAAAGLPASYYEPLAG